MKKIIFYVLSIFCLLALIFKTLNPNKTWDNQDFLVYMSQCPQINVQNVISTITSDWGNLNFLRTLFNTIITVFNFAIKVITNMTQAIIVIFYAISYFFNIVDVTDNQDVSTGGGGGPGWAGGR